MRTQIFSGRHLGAQQRAVLSPALRRKPPDRSQDETGSIRKHGRRCAAGCRRGRSAGFTYIGLLVLIAMMSLALTVVAQVWQSVQIRDKEEELLFVGNEFRRAIELYAANTSSYPLKLNDLLKDPGFPGIRRYLRKIYRDPITGRTEWGLVKPDGGAITGVYSLSEAGPMKQRGFRLADKDFEAKNKYSEWLFLAKGAPGATGTTTPEEQGISPADSGQLQPGKAGLGRTDKD